jgi:hypothetical protein
LRFAIIGAAGAHGFEQSTTPHNTTPGGGCRNFELSAFSGQLSATVDAVHALHGFWLTADSVFCIV